ncbi:DUF4340 domain-containing protein [Planctomyces sp. SH-PL62]|uniref:DUF4340 domain-containing protein n=1 Tax=Planctomyces sp. SH-PL62 TaxID=1636152 RepID=UPI00078E1BFB|nr:DUF4340 domain-containing protein [Planctomyces sp. SH-PL62]AMV38930.1 hypothetical protein VT85_15955 [Planctomyces sp. SH-PL62]
MRLWTDGGTASPIATLELGRTIQDERFVRAGADAAVEVVARKPLAAVDRPVGEWRETALVPASLFPIASVSIRRPGVDATVERGERGSWRLTAPVEFPADAARVERLLGLVGSLRVDPEAGGFVAQGIEDFAPFGLAPPAASIELKAVATGADPVVLDIGGSPPDHPDRVYVRKAGRDAVVAVDGKFLAEIPADLKALRSRRIAAINPAAVRRIEIDSPLGLFGIELDKIGWSLTAPAAARADRGQVETLLKRVEELQATEFFDPAAVPDSGVETPSVRLRIWQESPNLAGGAASTAGEPTFALDLGRHDLLRKVVFARTAGDTAILALPEAVLSALPSSSFAFRDLDLPAVSPTSVVRLTIVRPARTTVLEPGDPSGAPNRWRMIEPVRAEADAQAVTAALARLAGLRAGAFVADARGDLGRFGLTSPLLEVVWETRSSGETPGAGPQSLRIGAAVPDDPGKRYGTMSDFPAVFTIDAASLIPFTIEFHETRVLAFRPESVRRLVLRTETQTHAYSRRRQPQGVPADWSAEPGTSSRGVDLSKFNNLIEGLSELRAERFITYEGAFPPGLGLGSPRFTIEVDFGDETPPTRLRFGASLGGVYVCAATGDGESGPVFTLPAPVWEALLQSVEGGLPPIPADFFAPMPGG